MALQPAVFTPLELRHLNYATMERAVFVNEVAVRRLPGREGWMLAFGELAVCGRTGTDMQPGCSET